MRTSLLFTLVIAVEIAGCGSSSDGTPAIDATVGSEVPLCHDASPVANPDAGATPSMYVYILAGQSNAVGRARVEDLSADKASYAEPFALKYAEEINAPKDKSGGPPEISTEWLDEVKPREDGVFGPELSISRRLVARFGSDVALIKHATHGSSLYGDWDTGEENSLWQYMTTFIDARMAELPAGAKIVGMYWIQGNGDATLDRVAGDYAENLAYLIMRMRKKYGCMSVVIDRLHPATPYEFGDIVRAEQDQVMMTEDDVAIVETSDLELRDDPPIHYSADSYVVLGERMTDAFPATTCQ